MQDETKGLKAFGHVLIKYKDTDEVLVDKNNAIHFENFSEALALSLANRTSGNIHEMVFGRGASVVNGVGEISYFPPNVTGQEATLYDETYSKVVDDQSPLNTDRTNNYISVQHTQNNTYSDIIVTCLLDYSEPADQDLYDDADNLTDFYIFDELGLRSFDSSGTGKLLTHVVFHPVQKARNRAIEIVYTIRILMA